MENQKNDNQKLNPESLQSAKEKLRKLKEEINLDKPGWVEAQLDALASDLLKSGLSHLPGAPTLKEILEDIKTKHPMPDEAIDAAQQLAYLLEANWYGEDVPDDEQKDAEKFVTVLYDKLTPLLDSYGQG